MKVYICIQCYIHSSLLGLHWMSIAASEQSLDVLSSLLGNFLERFSTLLKQNFEDSKKAHHHQGSAGSMDVSCTINITDIINCLLYVSL